MKLGQISEARVPLQVVLGGASRTIDELARFGEGTIIELDKLAGESVELHAGGELIAYGEVVVIDESFGIRLTQLADGEEA